MPDFTNAQPSKQGLYVYSLGAGPDLVFLHGWGMHSGVWDDVAATLANAYRITLLDLPGHGHSRATATDDVLEDIGRRIAAVTPSPAVWIGWSLGGLIAQRKALHRQERVAGLVLVGSSPCFVRRPDWPHGMAPELLRQFADNLGQDFRATLKRFIALEVHGSEQEMSQLRRLRELVFQRGEPDRKALQTGLALLEDTDLHRDWKRLRCPVLIVLGRRDNLVPAAAGPAMRDLLPNARLQVLEGAAHAPFFSHPSEFIDCLRNFLDATSA
jgi:pimeloyl-[acyl-carrier protein] methyl ester esterase